MSISLTIKAFGPKDEKFLQMESIRNACHAGGVKEPEEVSRYFEFLKYECTPEGVEVNISAATSHDKLGTLISLDLIPKSATHLRLYLG